MVNDPTKILLDAGSSGPQGWSTSSQILRCPRRWRLQKAGYVGGKRDALIKGSLVHTGLAHYYARLQAVQQGWTGDPEPGPDAFYTPSEAVTMAAQKNGPAWLEHVRVATKAVKGYERTWAAFPEHVIAVEQLVSFAVPRTFGATPSAESADTQLLKAIAQTLPDPIVHTMRIDLIVITPDQRFLIIDHKTQSNPRASGTLAWDLSGQVVALHWWGQKQWGEKFAGVEIGAVNLTTGRIERRQPKMAPHAVREWPKMRTWIEVLKGMAQALYGDGLDYPQALSDQGPCLDRYGPCGFRDSCRLALPGAGGLD